ncbi:hypothetical protein, partial [Pseudomonas amygdali]
KTSARPLLDFNQVICANQRRIFTSFSSMIFKIISGTFHQLDPNYCRTKTHQVHDFNDFLDM